MPERAWGFESPLGHQITFYASNPTYSGRVNHSFVESCTDERITGSAARIRGSMWVNIAKWTV